MNSSRVSALLERWAPAAICAGACLLGLWSLQAELGPVQSPNDSSLHLALIRWARGQIDLGRVPLDGWFPYLSLGVSQFHHYQTLPHLVIAYASLVIGVETAYYWSLYLLLALWPISVFCGARLMGWNRWVAAASAVVAPVVFSPISYGYERASYSWYGHGLWTQLWGMWLLPLALGFSWQAVRRSRWYTAGALSLALTIACHFLTGYLALLTLGVWVLARPRDIPRGALRALVVSAGAVLVAAWALVPLVSDSHWSGNLEYYLGTIFLDSYGAPQVIGWLLHGQLYDNGRPPVITALVGAGLLMCAVRCRRDERARALLGLWLLSLFLFLGRAQTGFLVRFLPGSQDLPLHRYINGVHLAGMMLAGVALVAIANGLRIAARRLRPGLPRVVPATVAAVVGGLLVAPAWQQVREYDTRSAVAISQQQASDSTDGQDVLALLALVKATGDARVYAGGKSNWGAGYAVGAVPVYMVLENNDVDAVGLWLNTLSLSSDVEARFDEHNPAQYDLFNVGYLLLPADHPPPVPATLMGSRGRHRLYRVPGTGYVRLVDTTFPPVVADRTDMGRQNQEFLESAALAGGQFPTVAFGGADAAPPTSPGEDRPATPAGSVESQFGIPASGTFVSQVMATRRAVVLLKSSFDPRWTVTVDGHPARTQMVAPSFVGVEVEAGRHAVVFQYAPYPQYPLLLVIGGLTLVAMGVGEIGRSRRWIAGRWQRPGGSTGAAPP